MTTRGTMPNFRALEAEPTPEYDALAELFLAPDPEERPASSRVEPGGGALVIEALILGHLPVLGPAWIGQYARGVAEEAGAPVAVMHAGAGRLSIDVHGLLPLASNERCHDADEALRRGLKLSRRWILRADELDEPALWDIPGLDVVTLLTGADPMATVASYRTLKRCLSRPGAGEVRPRVRVAIMGADEASAAQAEASLRRAIDAFVDEAVEFKRCVGKIGASRPAVRLFEADRGQDASALVGLLRSIEARGIDPELREPRRSPVRDEPSPAPPILESEEPEPSGPGFVSCATSERPLASHVPGLEPLPARCPYAPEVELAATSDGRLHVLTRSGPGLPDDPMSRLLAVAAWADDHADLLRLAIPALARGRGERERTMHLFVPTPPARALAVPSLRVHLLAPVRIGDRTGWYRAELT